VQHIKNSA